jgi:hypothetical protein
LREVEPKGLHLGRHNSLFTSTYGNETILIGYHIGHRDVV